MKQIRFAFFIEKLIELPIALERKIQEEVVAWMAEAIIAVYKKGGIKTNDRSSAQQ